MNTTRRTFTAEQIEDLRDQVEFYSEHVEYLEANGPAAELPEYEALLAEAREALEAATH